ncbi:MAG: phosphate--AMP phosphotransferase, partial [Planctomycetota bacterium]
MLELVDLSKRIKKDVYKEVFPDLEIRMGAVQRAARAAGVPVVVVFEGWDAAGKGTLINRLTQALDPRGFKVHPVAGPDENEELHPWMWRFWLKLPAAGTFAIFDRSWYGRVGIARMEKLLGKAAWNQAYDDIQEFERQLADAGTVLVKLWLHIDRKTQKKRLKKLEKNDATAWKAGKEEWKQNKKYDEWVEIIEEMLQRTSTAYAPWTVVESCQGRFARVKVYETVISAVQAELDRREAHPRPKPRAMRTRKKSPTRRKTLLDRLDLSLELDRDDYKDELDDLQDRLFQLEHELYVARIPVCIVYEGVDAGGKGGNIRRLTRGLDPRGYEVVPVAAPNDEEKAHHYLWRFWRAVPKAGHITIFDRSWYGRVLVER